MKPRALSNCKNVSYMNLRTKSLEIWETQSNRKVKNRTASEITKNKNVRMRERKISI